MLRTLLIAAAVAMVGSSANATLFVNTFSGVMRDGTDGTGVFGLAPGTELSGMRVSVTFTIDDASPNFSEDVGPNYSSVRSKSWLAPSPITAVITINGVSYTFLNEDDGSVYREGQMGVNFGNAHGLHYGVRSWNYGDGPYSASTMLQLGAEDGVHQFLTSGDWRDVSDLDPSGLRNPVGVFEIIKYDKAAQKLVNNATGYIHWMEFNGARLPYPAIPEPNTWALMILGFGATGAALRRRYSIAYSLRANIAPRP